MNSPSDPLDLLEAMKKDLFVVNRWLGLPIKKDMGLFFLCRCLAVNQVLFDLRRSQVTGSPASFRGTIGELFGPAAFSIDNGNCPN